MKEVWRDPRAMAVALTNFYKINGDKVKAIFTLSGFEDESQKEKLKSYITEIMDEIKTLQLNDP